MSIAAIERNVLRIRFPSLVQSLGQRERLCALFYSTQHCPSQLGYPESLKNTFFWIWKSGKDIKVQKTILIIFCAGAAILIFFRLAANLNFCPVQKKNSKNSKKSQIDSCLQKPQISILFDITDHVLSPAQI